MFCEKCGAKLEDGAKFCEKCGTPVMQEEKVNQTAVQTEPVIPQQAAEKMPKQQQHTEKKNRTGLYIGGGVVIVALIAAIIFGVVKYQSLGKEDETKTAETAMEKASDEETSGISKITPKAVETPTQVTAPATEAPATTQAAETPATTETPAATETPAENTTDTMAQNQGGTMTYYVTNCNEFITLRTSDSTSASEITKIPLGEAVVYEETAGNGFYKVTYNGNTGYCLAQYLTEDASKIQQGAGTAEASTGDAGTYVTYHVVNCNESITLRTSDSTSAAEICQIPLGAAVSYVGTAGNGFYKIIYNGHTGYGLAAYLQEG